MCRLVSGLGGCTLDPAWGGRPRLVPLGGLFQPPVGLPEMGACFHGDSSCLSPIWLTLVRERAGVIFRAPSGWRFGGGCLEPTQSAAPRCLAGNCTWGMNCRFIHPGVNDKGNYSLISKPDLFASNGAPPGGPHPLMPSNPWVRPSLSRECCRCSHGSPCNRCVPVSGWTRSGGAPSSSASSSSASGTAGGECVGARTETRQRGQAAPPSAPPVQPRC